jgi:D-aminopeptidase
MSELPHIGDFPAGPRRSIADVAGVTVGHRTIATGALQTGVTVVVPHLADPYLQKLPAAAVVINGYGKSVGLLQLNELGVLETPIALTNTFAVGTVATAQIRAAIAAHPGLARTTTTVNPVVFECSDGYLSDLQALAVTEADYAAALAATAVEFERGSVGAGRGMSCFGLKGGVGTASRRLDSDRRSGMIGALVLANFGRPADLVVAGRRIGPALVARIEDAVPQEDQGSVIVVLAIDAPLDHRQLRRVALRGAAGIARTGSYFGHGSGDIVVAFSTAERIPHVAVGTVQSRRCLVETALEPLFRAAADVTEQAILDALFSATTVTGFAGHKRVALSEIAPDWATLG